MSLAMIKNHSLSEGDVIMFGDNAWNNTWCVLKIEDRKVLLINKSCVDIRNSEGYVTNFDPHLGKSFLSFPYIPENAEIYHSENWDRSGLKKWLNDEYYNTAFKNWIVEHKIKKDATFIRTFPSKEPALLDAVLYLKSHGIVKFK